MRLQTKLILFLVPLLMVPSAITGWTAFRLLDESILEQTYGEVQAGTDRSVRDFRARREATETGRLGGDLDLVTSTRHSEVTSASGTRADAPSVILAGAVWFLPFGLFAVIQRLVVNRLSVLSNAAEAIAQGDLDVEVSTSGGDEISELSRTFLAMQSSLRESREKIVVYREALERRVDRAEETKGAATESLVRTTHGIQIFKGQRALVIDDSEENCLALQEILASWGVTVLLGPDGFGAMAYLHATAGNSNPLDLVLLDRKMLDTHGLSLGSTLREVSALRSTRIILMGRTTTTFSGDLRTETIADCCVAKPISKAELYACLVKVVTGSSQPPDFTESAIPTDIDVFRAPWCPDNMSHRL